MNVKKLVTDDAAVSPVIGVILMVAITVLLAATAGSFFLGITDQSTQSTPTTAIGFDYDASTDHKNDALRIEHNGGNTVDAEQIKIVLNDGAATGTVLNERWTWKELSAGNPSEVTAGRSVNISKQTVPSVSPSDDLSLEAASVKVVWNDPDSSQTFVFAEWESPS
jgi:flagellin-like protein